MNWRTATSSVDTSGFHLFQTAYTNENGRIQSFISGTNEVQKWIRDDLSEIRYKLIVFLERFQIGVESSTSYYQKIDTGSWTTVTTSGLTSTNISSIVKLNNGRYIAGINNSVWYSDDEGISWTSLIANTFSDVEIVTDGNLSAVVAVGGLTAAWKIEGNTATNITSLITPGTTNEWNSILNVLHDGSDFVFLGQTVDDGSYQYACVAWSSDLSTFNHGESDIFSYTYFNAFLGGYYDNGTYYIYSYEDAAGDDYLPLRTTNNLKTAVPVLTFQDLLSTDRTVITDSTAVRAFKDSNSNVIVQIDVSGGIWQDILVNGIHPEPIEVVDLSYSFSYAQIDGLSIITGYTYSDGYYKVFAATDPTSTWTEITADTIGTGITNTVVVSSINSK